MLVLVFSRRVEMHVLLFRDLVFLPRPLDLRKRIEPVDYEKLSKQVESHLRGVFVLHLRVREKTLNARSVLSVHVVEKLNLVRRQAR